MAGYILASADMVNTQSRRYIVASHHHAEAPASVGSLLAAAPCLVLLSNLTFSPLAV